VQARTHWSPPSGALGRLTTLARARAGDLGDERGWAIRAAEADGVRSLHEALLGGTVAVVAEVKRRSPSKGSLDEFMDAPKRALQYEQGGARAISVLTEPSEFHGSSQDLLAVRAQVSCPLLRKDFHVHPIQMFEARACGAAAALLIVRALGPDDTRIMADAAREAGVEPVFEVRDESELANALDSGATIIGVNRRNLETLELEPEVITRLLPLVPGSCVAIAESAIVNATDVEEVAGLGADAVLVGSSLSVSANPQDAVGQLTGVARVRRRD
jgi:indole-3-glycerol phosphate synthase